MKKSSRLLGEEITHLYLSSKMSKIVVSILIFVLMIPWLYLGIFVVYPGDKELALYLMIIPGFAVSITGLLSLLYGLRQKKIKIYSTGLTNPKLHLVPIKQADFIFWEDIIAIEYGKHGTKSYYKLSPKNGKAVLLASSMFHGDKWKIISMTIEKIRKNLN